MRSLGKGGRGGSDLPRGRLVGGLAALLALAALLGLAPGARADLIVSVQNVSATPGSSGNTLEVDLTNSGAPMSPANGIGGFAFEVKVPAGAGVTFTGADNNTAFPYVFASGSFLGGPLVTVSPDGLTVDVTDLSSVATGTPLGTGAEVGLGRLFFDVAPGASGLVPVTLTPFPVTNLSDSLGNNLPAPAPAGPALTNGSINLGTEVPEPASLLLLGSGVLGLIAYGRSRRR